MEDEPNRFRTTLAALERDAHPPVEDLVETRPEAELDASAWAWDEQRRQARLAGGA